MYMTRLERNVQRCGFSIVKNPPQDGNCFFACVEDQLERLDNHNINHHTLRQELAAFLSYLVSEVKS